jgi:glycosyltransferase involved in cell wall biosynthesis
MPKSKILFILHLPPPIHGASLMGKYIRDSSAINSIYDGDYVNLSTSVSLDEGKKWKLKKIFLLIKIQLEVFTLLRKNKYDLCYMTLTAAGPGFYKDLLIVVILKLFGKNILYHFHNKGVEKNAGNRINSLLYQFAFRKTKVLLLSPSLYHDVARFVKKENVFYCPNGVPLIDQGDQNFSNAFPGRPVRLMFLSNMMVEKGVFILLGACENLKNRGLNFECHFIGPWYEITEEDFAADVAKLKLENSVFAHGKKYNDEKSAFFKSSDIFVFPTFYRDECFPLVLLEAMQHGLPVISTFEGGISDLVLDEETGFLVKQKDVMALTDKIALLIKETALRKQMGLRGKVRFNELFTMEKFEHNLTGVFNEVIKSNNR